MGNFYVTQPPYAARKDSHDFTKIQDIDTELWFLDEEICVKGSTWLGQPPARRIELRRWCQQNLNGDVTVKRGTTMGDNGTLYTWTFWFDDEADAMAFKLRWE